MGRGGTFFLEVQVTVVMVVYPPPLKELIESRMKKTVIIM